MDEKCAPASPLTPKPPATRAAGPCTASSFRRNCPGLDAPPWPGELGRESIEKVSAQAWKLWEERMKMILNEYRLMPWQKEAQELIAKQMEDFFFGEGAALPPGYVPQQAKVVIYPMTAQLAVDHEMEPRVRVAQRPLDDRRVGRAQR